MRILPSVDVESHKVILGLVERFDEFFVRGLLINCELNPFGSVIVSFLMRSCRASLELDMDANLLRLGDFKLLSNSFNLLRKFLSLLLKLLRRRGPKDGF